MANTRIKICGIKQAEHAVTAAKAGADYLGFVFAPSKRQITPERAAEILAEARAEAPMPPAVGVFVNETPGQIARTVQVAGLSYVQLSGLNSTEESRRIRDLAGVPVIKAVHMNGESDLARVSAYLEAVDYLLLDAPVRENYGGTGQSFDWNLFSAARAVAGTVPMFLAGGLNTENIAAAIRQAQPFAIDVSSGVETNGVKDSAKIEAFIRAARLAL
jgi:phosphoribosylanthranilate isomerase